MNFSESLLGLRRFIVPTDNTVGGSSSEIAHVFLSDPKKNDDLLDKIELMEAKLSGNEKGNKQLGELLFDFKRTGIDEGDFFKSFGITKDDILYLELLLENMNEFNNAFSYMRDLVTTSQSRNNLAPGNRGNATFSYDYMLTGHLFLFPNVSYRLVIDGDRIDRYPIRQKPALQYKIGENFELKEGMEVFDITGKKIDIDYIFDDEFEVVRGTYLGDDFLLEGSDNSEKGDIKAFFVKIKSKETGEEYITYSV